MFHKILTLLWWNTQSNWNNFTAVFWSKIMRASLCIMHHLAKHNEWAARNSLALWNISAFSFLWNFFVKSSSERKQTVPLSFLHTCVIYVAVGICLVLMHQFPFAVKRQLWLDIWKKRMLSLWNLWHHLKAVCKVASVLQGALLYLICCSQNLSTRNKQIQVRSDYRLNSFWMWLLIILQLIILSICAPSILCLVGILVSLLYNFIKVLCIACS